MNGLRWTTFIMTTVVTSSVSAGDARRARCARSATAAAAQRDRTAHDAPAGPDRPRRALRRRPARRRVRPVDVDVALDEVVVVGARDRRVDERRRRRRRAASPPGVSRSVGSLIATGNDASRERRIGRHRTASSRPVTLNAMWVAIDMPRRPVTSRQAPATSPKANRPGYSTGRKWMTANQADGGEPGEDVVEAGGERALQQPAVDELLDDRARRRRPSARAAPSSRRWPGRPASRRSPTAGRRRTCPARCSAAAGRRAGPARAG